MTTSGTFDFSLTASEICQEALEHMCVAIPGQTMAAENYTIHPDYQQLPEAIRHKVSPKEYSWMLQDGRGRLIESECYPDADMEDDPEEGF
ncbi:MAG: hypothetical protein ABFD97_20370 [Syntrophobacter sp.]